MVLQGGKYAREGRGWGKELMGRRITEKRSERRVRNGGRGGEKEHEGISRWLL